MQLRAKLSDILAVPLWAILVLGITSSAGAAGTRTDIGSLNEIEPARFLLPGTSFAAGTREAEAIHPDAIAAGTYRWKLRLEGAGKSDSWKITITAEGQALELTPASIAASDGSFLTPFLSRRQTSFETSSGAPRVRLASFLITDVETKALSTIDSKSYRAVPNFVPVVDLENGTQSFADISAETVRNVAKGVLWLNAEDQSQGRFHGCTGFLVSPIYVVTNDHCARGKDGTEFVVRAWAREPSGGCRCAAPTFQSMRRVYDPGKPPPDVAVFQLAEPAPTEWVLDLALEDSSGLPRLDLALFQFPRNDQMMVNFDEDCVIRAPRLVGTSPEPILVHGCDAARGSSGGPLFDRTLGNGVLAIHFEGHGGNQNRGNYAVPVDELISSLKAKSPAVGAEIVEFQKNR